MVAHVDMFGACAVLVITGKSDGLVVGVGEHGGGFRDGPKDLGENASQPKRLLHAVGGNNGEFAFVLVPFVGDGLVGGIPERKEYGPELLIPDTNACRTP